MPYDGEFARYLPLRRITETERVQQLLRRAKKQIPATVAASVTPQIAPASRNALPAYVVAIDGSNAEVDVETGYPGAKVGYCSVASVLLNLRLMDQLDEQRPVDPKRFRDVEEAASIDAALPGSNVVTRDHGSARTSFRESLFDVFHDVIVDADDRTHLLATYETLLALKPGTARQECPYAERGCDQHVIIPAGNTRCPCSEGRTFWSTDALRIHERFRDVGTNGEALGLVMQVWERVLLIHLMRCFETRKWLGQIQRVAFILDGPLGVFGPPAWLSAAISTELKRLNRSVRDATKRDLLLIGVEKSGNFVSHFESIDQTASGEPRFPPGTYFLPTDEYIKTRIVFSDSAKRYGLDTYFGRKFFYKTRSGARIVANLPFLSDEQDTLDSDDIDLYPEFGTICALLDRLVSSQFPNSLSPIVSAHAHAAIPLALGAKVLEQLAKALMRDD